MDPGCGGVCGRSETGEWLSGSSHQASNPPGGRRLALGTPHIHPVPDHQALTLHVQHVLSLLAVSRGQRLVLRLADNDTTIVLAVHTKPHCARHTPDLAIFLAAAHTCPAPRRHLQSRIPAPPPLCISPQPIPKQVLSSSAPNPQASPLVLQISPLPEPRPQPHVPLPNAPLFHIHISHLSINSIAAY